MEKTFQLIQKRVLALDREGRRDVVPLYLDLETAIRSIHGLHESVYKLTYHLLDALITEVLIEGGKAEDVQPLVDCTTTALSASCQDLSNLFTNEGWRNEKVVTDLLIAILRDKRKRLHG